jgi:tripartite-type tricarboxylate transporter receptor subunit TctC
MNQFQFRTRHRAGRHQPPSDRPGGAPLFLAKTVPELIAYAKANPGNLNLAKPSKGTGAYMAADLFKTMIGVDLVHVPYRGDPLAFTDLLGGEVQGTVQHSFED